MTVVFGYQEADNVARVCLRSSGSAKIACGRYTKLDFEGILVSLRSSFGGQRSIQLSYGCVAVHLADWPGMGNGPARGW
jgi:hypothetical protein